MSLNWSTIDEVTTRNTTAYFIGPLCINSSPHDTQPAGNYMQSHPTAPGLLYSL